VQHYKTPLTLGQKLTISLEALQLEVGTNVCPLLTSFHPLDPLTTSCCCKSLWDGLDHFGLTLDMEAEKIPLPREHDALLSSLFVINSPPQEILRSLQWCRISWKALFLSDLVAANGHHIKRRFLAPPDATAGRLSSLQFGEERPTPSDWATWAEFWGRYTMPGLNLESPLGRWIAPTHRVWD